MHWTVHLRYNLFKILNWLLTPAETFILARQSRDSSATPLVFIIGPPRSGTTILYQLLVHCYDFAYINNFVGNFYRCPNLAVRLSRVLQIDRRAVAFTSRHGVTPGLAGPHEFGDFWYRWFPKTPHYADAGTLSLARKQALQNTVDALAHFFNRTLLFKNVIHSVRIKALQDIFPQALFIVCERNPLYTAQSIYQVRKERAHNHGWWSVQPREIEELRSKPMLEQCVSQLYYVTRQIEEDCGVLPAERYIKVMYEQLCEETSAVLAGIESRLENQRLPVVKRPVGVPHIRSSNRQSIEDTEFQRIKELVEQLWQ
ncbi:MAG: sulfotransferase [bacterium]